MDRYTLLSIGSICAAVGYLLGVAWNFPFPSNSTGQPLIPEHWLVHTHLSRLKLLVAMAMLCVLVHLLISWTSGYKPEVGGATRCTCAPERVRCEVHDMELLLELSKNIRGEGDIIALCLQLEINQNFLLSYSRSHGLAVYNLLRENWYHQMDGLRANSEGLRQLKHALMKIKRGRLNETIIQRCLDHT